MTTSHIYNKENLLSIIRNIQPMQTESSFFSQHQQSQQQSNAKEKNTRSPNRSISITRRSHNPQTQKEATPRVSHSPLIYSKVDNDAISKKIMRHQELKFELNSKKDSLENRMNGLFNQIREFEERIKTFAPRSLASHPSFVELKNMHSKNTLILEDLMNCSKTIGMFWEQKCMAQEDAHSHLAAITELVFNIEEVEMMMESLEADYQSRKQNRDKISKRIDAYSSLQNLEVEAESKTTALKAKEKELEDDLTEFKKLGILVQEMYNENNKIIERSINWKNQFFGGLNYLEINLTKIQFYDIFEELAKWDLNALQKTIKSRKDNSKKTFENLVNTFSSELDNVLQRVVNQFNVGNNAFYPLSSYVNRMKSFIAASVKIFVDSNDLLINFDRLSKRIDQLQAELSQMKLQVSELNNRAKTKRNLLNDSQDMRVSDKNFEGVMRNRLWQESLVTDSFHGTLNSFNELQFKNQVNRHRELDLVAQTEFLVTTLEVLQSKKLDIEKKIQTLNANIVSLNEVLNSCSGDFKNYCEDTLYLLQQENNLVVDLIKEMYVSLGNSTMFESINIAIDTLKTANEEIIIELEEILTNETSIGDLASPKLSEAIKSKARLHLFDTEEMQKHEAKLQKLRKELKYLNEFEIPNLNAMGQEIAILSDELSLLSSQKDPNKSKLFQNLLSNK